MLILRNAHRSNAQVHDSKCSKRVSYKKKVEGKTTNILLICPPPSNGEQSDVKLMFSNIEEICEFHHGFLRRLKAARPLTVGKVSTIITDIGEKGFMVMRYG